MEQGEHGEHGEGSTELETRAAEVLRAAEAAAAATGRAMVSEARGVRRRMLEDAERRRRELVAELERVRTMLDAAIAALRATPPDADAPEAAAAPDDLPDDPEAPRPAVRADVGSGEGEAPQVGALFAKLRAEPAPPAPKVAPPKAVKPPTRGEVVPQAEPEPEPDADSAPDAEPEPHAEAESAAPPEDPDAASRRRRAAVLEPLLPALVRGSKRLLQDEQNTLLDAVRRARGRPEARRLLPDPEHQRDAWVEVVGPGVDGAYLGGRAAVGKTGRVTSAPGRVVAELVAVIVKPLRERLITTIESVVADGPYESPAELQRVIGSAIGARYREWKGSDLEVHVLDVLSAAYARGSYDGAGPAAPLRWVPDEPGRCPDCDDNALEPTLKGGSFPTGQLLPPAHPGCRCLVVLAGDAGTATRTT